MLNDHPIGVTGSGIPPYLPVWTTASNLGSSVIFQSGTDLTLSSIDDNHALLGVLQRGTNIAVAGSNSNTSGTQAFGVVGQTSSPAGAGVVGNNLATSGVAAGVMGVSTSSTAGTGVYGKGGFIGVQGVTTGAQNNGAGVLGEGESASNEGSSVTLTPRGTWGDTNQAAGVGVLATNDGGIALAAFNKAENITTAKFENDEATDETAPVVAAIGSAYQGICIMDVSGDLACNGSKSDVVPVDGGSRKVALYAVEAAENWFEDAGSGQLSSGTAVVHLEPTYTQTVNGGVEYHVFLTPKGDCNGLYVTNETADSFEVRELGAGKANIAFDYRILARRKGYETVRLADFTKTFNAVRQQNKLAVGMPRQTPGPGNQLLVTPASAIAGVTDNQHPDPTARDKK